MNQINEPQTSLQFSFMGEGALLCEVVNANAKLELVVQQRIWQLAHSVKEQLGVLEVVPGMNNLLVVFDPIRDLVTNLKAQIQHLWMVRLATSIDNCSATLHHIPVVYGGDMGVDIVDLAAYAGLSVEEVIERHSQAEYTVYALGSQPGLPYLGGLDPQLNKPRRASARTQVKAGAVIIGGSQASVLSRTSACGWHIIGYTAIECFNPASEPAALFSPGDTVKFIVEEVCL